MNKYDICVIGGCGHVGLPLAAVFANGGKRVIINDVNENVIDLVKNCKVPFMEEGLEDLLKNTVGKTLFLSKEKKVISEAEFVIVVVGTPVDEHLNPVFSTLKKFFDEIIPFLCNGQTIILRSTLYPGLTKKLNQMLKETGKEISVCFCPERILEGRSIEELHNLPQIVSGFDQNSIKKVSDMFRIVTKDIIIVEPIEAELAKLFTNTWRYIQFAAANQFYMMAEDFGADFYKIHHAMTYNYPRTKSFPKAGFAAGPCLFKDCMQLSAFTDNTFFLGHAAMLVNEGLPNFIVSCIENKTNLSEKSVGILGMAFKSESDDIRESLSYKLKKILQIKARQVYCSDHFVKDERLIPEDELIEKSDIIIIGAPHEKYRTLNYKNKHVVDVWNMIRGKQ
ncbi:MAG TPA: nucleotide sugar dehydrogenase [Lentisphaeria bacterium]|nr:MAG: nucleotide sugar dehydrogenase [Lentisphaerae bacterium GWF2_38_69]HBM15733.1 nucleotide sugar dehydrogenase [Lentisphaeria bacterium]